MFRSTLTVLSLAIALLPATASAGRPSPVPAPLPSSGQTFMCIGVQGDGAVAVSGTVVETDEAPIAVPQDFVATVQADVELVVWEAGSLQTIANTNLKGSLRSGMPTPGTAYGLAPAAEEAAPFAIIESLRMLRGFNGEQTATIKLAGKDLQVLPCQVLNFPAGLF